MNQSPAIDNLREFLIRFFSKIGLVRRIFLVMAVLTLLLTLTVPTTYTTTGEIIVLSTELLQNDSRSPGGEMTARYMPVTLKDMETEATILRSLPLLKKTVSALHDEGTFFIEPGLLDKLVKKPLKENIIVPVKGFIQGIIQKFAPQEEAVPEENPEVVELTKMALSSLEIVPLPGSNVIVINFETKNVQMGRIFVDRLMDEYLQRRNDIMTGTPDDNLFLQKKQLYQERLDKLSNEKIELFDEYEIHNPKEELSIVLQTISSETVEFNLIADRLLQATRWQLYYKENIAKLAFANIDELSVPANLSAGSASANQLMVDRDMQQQFEQLGELRAQFDSAILTYTPDTPQVQQLQDQLELAKKRIIALLKTRQKELMQETSILEATRAQKENRIQSYKERATILTEVMVKETGIDTELSAVAEAFSSYSRQFEEMRSEKLLNKEKWKNVRVLSYAPVPLEPSSPKKISVLFVGLVASCITAVTFGFFLEIFDQRFHTPSQLASQLGLPVIAVIDAEAPQSVVPFSLHPLRFFKWLTQ